MGLYYRPDRLARERPKHRGHKSTDDKEAGDRSRGVDLGRVRGVPALIIGLALPYERAGREPPFQEGRPLMVRDVRHPSREFRPRATHLLTENNGLG